MAGRETNPHMVWRMELAREAGRVWASNPKLASIAVAGSVATGLADRFSDLELDCYWLAAPNDEDRRNPIGQLGGQIVALWDYDAEEGEWSEDFSLRDLTVTVSNFLVPAVNKVVSDVVDDADPDLVKHMRLAAIQRCSPLSGMDIIDGWRNRLSNYPDALVERMLQRALTVDALAGWPQREALWARGDLIELSSLLARTARAVVVSLLALNRTYQAHRLLKWQRPTIDRLTIAPVDLQSRLDALWEIPRHGYFDDLHALMTETLDLAQVNAGYDAADFREVLGEKRNPITHCAHSPASPTAPRKGGVLESVTEIHACSLKQGAAALGESGGA